MLAELPRDTGTDGDGVAQIEADHFEKCCVCAHAVTSATLLHEKFQDLDTTPAGYMFSILNLTLVQGQGITARMALIVGAKDKFTLHISIVTTESLKSASLWFCRASLNKSTEPCGILASVDKRRRGMGR
jgi:hypothetical protein